MDDKKRELLDQTALNPDGTGTTFGKLISEAGYVLTKRENYGTLGDDVYQQGRKKQRAKDAAIVENFDVSGSWSPLGITRSIAKAIREQTDAE